LRISLAPAKLMPSRSLARISEAISFWSSGVALGTISGAAASGFFCAQSAAAL
jgi:hypothetical protein